MLDVHIYASSSWYVPCPTCYGSCENSRSFLQTHNQPKIPHISPHKLPSGTHIWHTCNHSCKTRHVICCTRRHPLYPAKWFLPSGLLCKLPPNMFGPAVSLIRGCLFSYLNLKVRKSQHLWKTNMWPHADQACMHVPLMTVQ